MSRNNSIDGRQLDGSAALRWGIGIDETDHVRSFLERAVDRVILPEQNMNMKGVDEIRMLAERMRTSGGKRIAVTPDSARTVAHALHVYADHLSRPSEEHKAFTVDVYDDKGSIIETMAYCSSLLVGRAAFDQAIRERPKLEVTLRQGIRIVARQAAMAAVSRDPLNDDVG